MLSLAPKKDDSEMLFDGQFENLVLDPDNIGGLATPEEVDSPRAPRSGCWLHVEGEEPAWSSPTEAELPTTPTEKQPSRPEDYPVHECGSPTEEATPDLHDGYAIPKTEQEWLALQTPSADEDSPGGKSQQEVSPFGIREVSTSPSSPG